jgi:branched-chain amino acid transport system ATP-binding protein
MSEHEHPALTRLRDRVREATVQRTPLRIRAGGTTIVWIEHIVHALLAVVDRLVVLNFGRKIAEGHPPTVMASKEVREIYTGIAA